MKAEPESRIVKGIDVKFSATDFELAKTTAWEGVRNHQAKVSHRADHIERELNQIRLQNFLKDQIKVGDEVLFYASNTKGTPLSFTVPS